MRKTSFIALRGLAVLSLSLVFGLARAQDYAPTDADPPDRAARLSLIRGDVSLQPAGEEAWTSAVLNRPLTTGDKLWTDQGARAEIQVGQSDVRLDSNTGFSFLNVDDDTIQMRITEGVVIVSVRALTNEHIEVDTPNLAVSLLRPGSYRVEVNDAGDTTVVKVSDGEAEANGGSQNVVVHAQESVTFRGTDQINQQFASLGAPDEFDDWSLGRDRRDESAESSRTAQYVSPDVTGYEDLDDNGSWSSEAEYGYVWTPTYVAADWSPYRYGRWSYIGPWGWTWIDDAPWGYAPFHYGRWAHVRERWCWVPGPRHVRAVYAPALVGWSGRGSGVAWFPLGPREVYVPARRYSHRYVERVNYSNTVIVNRTDITNVYDNNRGRNWTYRNRAVPGAVTAVSRETFTSAQRVGGRRVRADEQQSAGTVATARAPQIQPGRESRLGGGETRRNVRVPPQTVASRQVVVNRNPPPAAARFARNRGQNDTAREHRSEAAPGRNPPNSNVDPNARVDVNRARDERNSYNTQRTRDDRPPQARTNADRTARTNQPQVEESPGDRWVSPNRLQEDRPQQRQQQEREQQGREQQERHQVDFQQRQQQEQVQRQERERAARQWNQRQQPDAQQAQQQERRQADFQQRQQQEQSQRQEQDRAARQRDQRQQSDTQQTQQRQREPERPHVEHPQPERQNRSEPQRQPDHNERRSRDYQQQK